jgi:hypothetical protein
LGMTCWNPHSGWQPHQNLLGGRTEGLVRHRPAHLRGLRKSMLRWRVFCAPAPQVGGIFLPLLHCLCGGTIGSLGYAVGRNGSRGKRRCHAHPPSPSRSPRPSIDERGPGRMPVMSTVQAVTLIFVVAFAWIGLALVVLLEMRRRRRGSSRVASAQPPDPISYRAHRPWRRTRPGTALPPARKRIRLKIKRVRH